MEGEIRRGRKRLVNGYKEREEQTWCRKSWRQ